MKEDVWSAGVVVTLNADKKVIQIYTGEGKGKTTAAVGLAVRASASQKVFFCQLLKDGESSEISVLKAIPNIDVKCFGEGKRIIKSKGNKKEKENIKKAFSCIRDNYKKYNVVIIDEAISAVDLGLISDKDLIILATMVSGNYEVILTGRGATKNIIDKADLVTEMRKKKHYFDRGISSRKGIEY